MISYDAPATIEYEQAYTWLILTALFRICKADVAGSFLFQLHQQADRLVELHLAAPLTLQVQANNGVVVILPELPIVRVYPKLWHRPILLLLLLSHSPSNCCQCSRS